jgi:hypothetical protein
MDSMIVLFHGKNLRQFSTLFQPQVGTNLDWP